MSYKTIYSHYKEHENQLLTNSEVMDTFNIKCIFTLWKKRRKIRTDEKIEDRYNLVTCKYMLLIPGKGYKWAGGTIFINPETANDDTKDILQRAADNMFKQYANLIRIIELINKPQLRTFLLKNQAQEAKRIEQINQ